MNKKILLFIIIILSIFPVNAYNIDNNEINISNYSVIKVYDDLNYKYINDYNYSLFIDNKLYSSFNKDDLIEYPDDVNLVLYVPDSINTDIESGYDIFKSNLIIIISLLFGIVFIIFLLYIIYKKVK